MTDFEFRVAKRVWPSTSCAGHVKDSIPCAKVLWCGFCHGTGGWWSKFFKGIFNICVHCDGTGICENNKPIERG